MLLARLALLQDYLVRHLDEPPASLLPLIRANLFSLLALCSSPSFPLTPELDTSDAPALQPYFLLLAPPPGLAGPEVPRLDGLAMSSLLATPKQGDYPAPYCFLAVWRLVQALPPPPTCSPPCSPWPRGSRRRRTRPLSLPTTG